MEQAKPKSSMTDFRRKNLRIDYYPTDNAAAVIERLKKCNPNACTREIVDALIVRGGKAFFQDEVGTNK